MNLESKKQFDYFIGGFGIFFLKPIVRILGKMLKRDHDLTPQGNILVLKLLGGGSLVLAYPGLLSLRKNLKENQKLILITTNEIVPFAECMDIFDEVYSIDDRSIFKLIKSFLAIAFKAFGRIDTCLDLEVHSRGTAIISLICGARNRIGFYKESIYWRIDLYTHLVFYNTFSRSSNFYESLISLLGIKIESFESASLEFQKSYVRNSSDPTITIGFSCSRNARERMLSARQWIQVIERSSLPQNSKILLLGGLSDHTFGESIRMELESRLGISCQNLCGQLSLKESLQHISASAQFFGIDSSLLHFARLLGKDTTSFWGPTDPNTRLNQRTNGKDIIQYQKISCSPCVHFAFNPPCEGENRCIEAIFDPSLKEMQITWSVQPGKTKPIILGK